MLYFKCVAKPLQYCTVCCLLLPPLVSHFSLSHSRRSSFAAAALEPPDSRATYLLTKLSLRVSVRACMR